MGSPGGPGLAQVQRSQGSITEDPVTGSAKEGLVI